MNEIVEGNSNTKPGLYKKKTSQKEKNIAF